MRKYSLQISRKIKDGRHAILVIDGLGGIPTSSPKPHPNSDENPTLLAGIQSRKASMKLATLIAKCVVGIGQ